MKTLLIISIIIINYSSLFAQKELDVYLKTASENNPALKATFSEYRAALEMLPQVKALPDPEVMFEYFVTPLYQEMGIQRFTLSASQMFPWYGQLKAQEQAAAAMAKAKYESFIDQRNKLFYDIKLVYFKWYVQNKSVKITEENLKLMNSLRELAKTNFETGKSSFVNVLRTDMEIAEMENKLQYLKEGEPPLRVEFEKLLNSKTYPKISFPDTLWKDSLQNTKSTFLDSMIINNPSLKKMDYEIASYNKKMLAAKKMGYPSFSLGVGYMNMDERPDMKMDDNGMDMWMFPEIGVMIPLYRKKYKAMINEAKYKSESVVFEKSNMTNELTSELEMAFRDYLDAQRRVILYTRLYKLSKNVRELLLSEYSSMGMDFEEILRVQNEEFMYAVELEDARAMINQSVAYIDYLTGKER